MHKTLILLAALLPAACGFHLKGTQAYDKLPYQNWYVSGGALQQPLETALLRADGRPVHTGEQAKIVVSHADIGKDVLTITRGALINEYRLTLTADAQAYRNGAPLGSPMHIVIRRKLEYADNEILGKAEEEETIRQEMRRDAAEQIVRRLTFLPAGPKDRP